MNEKKISGTVKTENVIWIVAASLLIGFVSGVAFGIYKSGTISDPHRAQAPAAMDEQRQQSIDALEARAEQNPRDSAVWIELGHHYFDGNRPDAAIDAYEKALAIEPENADIWTDLGVMYRRDGRPEKAVDAFDRAMKIDASHQISRFNKGIVLFHDLEDETGALAAWESLLAINPKATSPGGQALQELVDHIKKGHTD